MKKHALAGLAAGLLALAPLAALAQAPLDDGIGMGGRVEVAPAGYALTLPDGWLHVQPSSSDVGAIIAEIRGMLPELAPTIEAALAGGSGFSLLAVSAEPEATFAENCNVLDRPSNGASIDAIATDELVKLHAFRELLASGPVLTFVELPTGRAGRLDIGLALPEFETASTTYLLSDGAWVHTLTCTDLVRPVDAWLGIAESFEFLGSNQ